MNLKKLCNDMDEFEIEIQDVIEKTHKKDVSYWEMLRSLLNICSNLQMQADAEYWRNIK